MAKRHTGVTENGSTSTPHSIEWTETPDDGSQALLVVGGGIDGSNGFTIASHDADLHVVGPTSPLIPGYVGCVVIRPDRSRYLARVVPDPLAEKPGARYCVGDVGGERRGRPQGPQRLQASGDCELREAVAGLAIRSSSSAGTTSGRCLS